MSLLINSHYVYVVDLYPQMTQMITQLDLLISDTYDTRWLHIRRPIRKIKKVVELKFKIKTSPKLKRTLTGKTFDKNAQ